MLHCGLRSPDRLPKAKRARIRGFVFLALVCSVFATVALTGSAFATSTTLSGTDVAVDNDANHDGTFSDTESVPKNVTYPWTVTYRMTLTAGTFHALVQTLSDDQTAAPLVSATRSPSCASLIGVDIPAHISRTCYYDATLTGPSSTPLVNNVLFTFNAAPFDSAYDSSTVNFPSLTLDKSSTTALVTAPGQVVSYSYVITNSGTVTVTGIALSDNNVDSAPTCPATLLAPGASMTCTAGHTATAAELFAGHVDNTATATSSEAANVTDSLSIPTASVFSDGGSFVVGDLTVGPPAQAVGKSVTFWGAQWWKLNSLSGGSGPAAFKGFQDAPDHPACGVNWTSKPGNSTPPPAGVPPYMAVIVSSAISKTGSSIGGDTVHIVIVKTASGYEGNPGHAGTGTIVGVVC
jgi:hypothetical protein